MAASLVAQWRAWSQKHRALARVLYVALGSLVAWAGCNSLYPPFTVQSGEGTVLLPINEVALATYLDSHEKGDTRGENHLILTGWAWIVKDGERVRLLERHGSILKVKVEDGRSNADGHEGWLPSSWVVPKGTNTKQAGLGPRTQPRAPESVELRDVYKLLKKEFKADILYQARSTQEKALMKREEHWRGVEVTAMMTDAFISFRDSLGQEHTVTGDDTFGVAVLPWGATVTRDAWEAIIARNRAARQGTHP